MKYIILYERELCITPYEISKDRVAINVIEDETIEQLILRIGKTHAIDEFTHISILPIAEMV